MGMISTSRRTLCKALALPALWAAGMARAAGDKNLRVAILFSGYETIYAAEVDSLISGLRELGYIEGRNLTVDRRYTQFGRDQMPPTARELVSLSPDIIITACAGSTRAAMQATQSIPIVMVNVADPVGQGFVRTLAQPGTNVTGRSSQSRELMPKMLELMHAAVPKATRVAVFINTTNTAHEALWSDVEAAARPLRITPVRADVRGPADLNAALDRLKKISADGLIVLPDDPMTFNLRQRIIDAVNQLRIPTLYGPREFVVEGGFMSYGESFPDSYRRVGTYVDKLARGAKAAELPIEQPTRFQLVINLKTASMLGITPPKTLLLRADETIR
jgi:putative ABC transport system substrate-binding protein